MCTKTVYSCILQKNLHCGELQNVPVALAVIDRPVIHICGLTKSINANYKPT